MTIPQHLRNRYGLKPKTEVVFEETAASGRVAQLKTAMGKSRGSANIKSTAELMRLTRSDD